MLWKQNIVEKTVQFLIILHIYKNTISVKFLFMHVLIGTLYAHAKYIVCYVIM